jgi:anion-transporting  ArsA/GET3 family ATPase
MVKVWQLTRGGARGSRSGNYDLVVLDAPATGHALGMLGSPQTFGAIARVGPIAGQARQLQELLQTPSRTAYLAVALATEMAVTEVLELQEGLERQLGRDLSAVIVNALLPRRFTAGELNLIESLGSEVTAGRGSPPGLDRSRVTETAEQAATESAVRAARAVHYRARFQSNQLARLRRRSFDVVSVPFVWGAEVDLAAVTEIAKRLERKL